MPRIVDHEAQRAEILDGCFQLFARRGYGAVTMRGAAKSLGVSTGTLYHYFDGKEDLFRRMFERNARRDVLEAELMIDEGEDLKMRLRKLEVYLEDRAEYLQDVVVVAIDYLRATDDPASRVFLAETAGFYRDALGERLGLPGESLGATAFSFVVGMFVHRIFDPNAPSFAEQLTVLAALA
jgi:AcrR family transcriptional regulator